MNDDLRHFFEFDDFCVEVEERRLTRNGSAIALASRDFDILLALVQHSGQTVDKNDLMETVWEDTFVEEGNLNRHVSTLRKTLGDDPKSQRFIKTIPKRGYRFTADVREIVESNRALSLGTMSSGRLVVREETTEGFWTTARLAIAASLVIAVGFFGAWAWSNSGRSEASARFTPRAEAQKAYSRGRELWQNRAAGSLHEATLLLEQAVQLDPEFALAHSALADAYAFDYGNWKKAEAHALKAIEIDPNLGEPHASIGFVRMFWEWNLAQAEQEFKQAVRLSPDYATGHQWYSVNLAATGHADAALVEITRAFELEPDSASIKADRCRTFYFMAKYDDALAQCQNLLATNPNDLNANLYLYEIYTAKQMDAEAVETHFKIEELTNFDQPPNSSEKLRGAFAKGGIRAFWRAQSEIDARRGPQRYRLAQIHARLGDDAQTLYWLDEAYKNRDFDFVLFAADPVFAPLREDLRLKRLHDLIKN